MISYLSQAIGEAWLDETTCSDVAGILESVGDAGGISGAGLPALSMERASLCSGTTATGDFIFAALERGDGVGASEGFCSESLPKKLAASAPPSTNTPIAAGKIPKRVFFFVTTDRETSLVTDPPLTAAGKLVEWGYSGSVEISFVLSKL